MGSKASVELVLDCAQPDELAEFWREALDYRHYYADESIVVLVPKSRAGYPLILQAVPEPKAGKNRMHLDVIVDDLEPEVERLETLGARRIDEHPQRLGETRWVRMADPEHNEFCVSTGVDW